MHELLLAVSSIYFRARLLQIRPLRRILILNRLLKAPKNFFSIEFFDLWSIDAAALLL